MSSYGANNHAATVDTPSRNHRFCPWFRLWTVTCSCMVAIQTWFIYGYSIGYKAPVLNGLGDVNTTYTSLRKISYQDTFSVSSYMQWPVISRIMLHFNVHMELQVLLSVGALLGALYSGWLDCWLCWSQNVTGVIWYSIFPWMADDSIDTVYWWTYI